MEHPQIKGGGVLGEKITEARRQLDTFTLPDSTDQVTYTSDEVMCYCPITGQPDWYAVDITISHSALGLESKALKLYLQSFADKDEGQFCEMFADRIATDVHEAVNDDAHVDRAQGIPGVEVVLKQKPRGGISIEAQAHKGAWED